MGGESERFPLERLRSTLAEASATTDLATRVLEVVAVVKEAVVDLGFEPVVVGGLAVTYWTRGSYTSLEADVLLPRTSEVEARLDALGFARRGRHWELPGTDVGLETPASALSEEQLTTRVGLPSGRSVLVLSPEEMLFDRVREFVVWGGQAEPFRQVGYLLAVPELDLELALERAKKERLDPALRRLQELIRERRESGREIESWELGELARELRREKLDGVKDDGDQDA